jgi:HEAT repeat protein
MILAFPVVILVLYIIISILLLVILVVISVVFIRRFYKESYYKNLDREREFYAPFVEAIILTPHSVDETLFQNKVNSIKWLAVEDLLLKALESSDEESRVSVLRAFEKLGIIDVYIADLKSKDRFRASLCAERLGRVNCLRAVPELIQALVTDIADLKNMAINSLGLLGDERAIPHLMERFREVIDDKENISGRIIKNALISFGTKAIPLLKKDMESTSWRVRSRVLDVLCEIDDPALKELFLEALIDPEPDVRAKGARGLGRIKEAGMVLEPLTKLYDDETWVVRYHCVKSLGLIGDKSSVDLFKRAITDSNWQVRRAAAEALGSFGVSAIKELTDVMLRSADRFAREQVAEELQRSGLIYAIIENLRNPSGSKVSEEMLFDVGKNGVISPLLEAMDDDDPVMRCKVAALLGRIGNFRAREVLERSAKDDVDLKVKLEAGKALESVPVEDPAAA